MPPSIADVQPSDVTSGGFVDAPAQERPTQLSEAVLARRYTSDTLQAVRVVRQGAATTPEEFCWPLYTRQGAPCANCPTIQALNAAMAAVLKRPEGRTR